MKIINSDRRFYPQTILLHFPALPLFGEADAIFVARQRGDEKTKRSFVRIIFKKNRLLLYLNPSIEVAVIYSKLTKNYELFSRRRFFSFSSAKDGGMSLLSAGWGVVPWNRLHIERRTPEFCAWRGLSRRRGSLLCGI